MKRIAICVTLDDDNVTWLKGRVGTGAVRSVSDLVDRLVSAARTQGHAAGTRSVVGTIDIDPSDPTLEKADAAVGVLFEQSLGRPLVAAERSPRYDARRSSKRKRRG